MNSARRSRLKPALIHALRIAALIALVAPLRLAGVSGEPAAAGSARGLGASASGTPPLERVQAILPAAADLAPADSNGAWWSVLDRSDQTLGIAAQTSPAGGSAVGYRGPSNVLLVADPDQRIVAATLIDSRDTPEHVQAITDSEAFFDQFTGCGSAGPSARWTRLAARH